MKVVIAHGGNIGFPGGGTNRVLAFAKSLAENGYKVSLVVPRPVGEIPESVANSVSICTVPVKPRSVWDQAKIAIFVSLKAKKVAKKEEAMLQIEHSTLGGAAAMLGCSNYVLDVHDLEFDGALYNNIPLAPRLIHYLEGKAVKTAAKIVAVSEDMKQFISNEWSIRDDKIEVIPNATRYEPAEFEEDNEEIEGQVSFLGVLTQNVDYDKFIKLARSSDNIKIYVVGDGPMRPRFLKKLKTEGTKNIMAPGYLPDEEVCRILVKSQVCINPRKSDLHTRVSAGIKNFDYSAFGKAIATDRDGTTRIFERYGAALVSDPASPDEFVENVHRLLGNEILRKRLGQNAKSVVKEFTWKKEGDKLVTMYERLKDAERE